MSEYFYDIDVAIEVPVNALQLIDDTDYKTREESIAYNAPGMDLVWHFTGTDGVIAAPVTVTPTTGGGDYDWAHIGEGMYKIGIPASGGASINNDTAGRGFFTGSCTGVLPWRSPTLAFRAGGMSAQEEIISLLTTGSGARTVAVTVNDGVSPVVGALVRMTRNSDGLTFAAATSGSGQITFNLDDGTYTVAITYPLYSFGGATLVVDGNKTPVYSMTDNSPAAPADPAVCVVWVYLKRNQTAIQGAKFYARPSSRATFSSSIALAYVNENDVTDASGYAQLTLFRDVIYDFFIEGGSGLDPKTLHLREELTVPDLATASLASLMP